METFFKRYKHRLLSFSLGLGMGILLFTVQKLQIQPLEWIPSSLLKQVFHAPVQGEAQEHLSFSSSKL